MKSGSSFLFLQGTYGVYGYQPTVEKIPRQILHTGEYAVDFVMHKDNEEVFRARVFLSIIKF